MVWELGHALCRRRFDVVCDHHQLVPELSIYGFPFNGRLAAAVLNEHYRCKIRYRRGAGLREVIKIMENEVRRRGRFLFIA